MLLHEERLDVALRAQLHHLPADLRVLVGVPLELRRDDEDVPRA